MAKKKKKNVFERLFDIASNKNTSKANTLNTMADFLNTFVAPIGSQIRSGIEDTAKEHAKSAKNNGSDRGYTYKKLGGRGGSHIGRDADERQYRYKSLYRNSWEPRENPRNKFDSRNSRKARTGNNGFDMSAKYKTDDKGLLSVDSKKEYGLQETKDYKKYKEKHRPRWERAVTGALMQTGAQYGDTVGRLADATNEDANMSRQMVAAMNANMAKNKKKYGLSDKEAKKRMETSEYFAGVVKRSEEARKQRQEALGKLNKAGTKNIEKAKEGLGTAGQFLIDTLAAGTQFGADTLLSGGTGALRMIAMGGRSYAGGVMEAKEEGADENKAELYGLLSAAREVGTEKIFNVGYMNKIMGNSFAGGKASASLENAAAKVANRFAKSKTGKTALYNSIISSQMMLTEGAEEFIADVIDVPMKRATYKADAEFDLNDALRSGAIGSILGGLGIGGQVSQARSDYKTLKGDEEFRRTNRVVKRKDNSSPQSVRSNPKGRSAVHEMINTGLKQDQNTASYRMARQIQDQIDTGQGIIPGQLSALQNHLATNQRESQERMNAARRKAIETYDRDAAEKRTRDNFRTAISNREADVQEFINTREARGGNNYVQSEEAKKNYSITPEVVAANSEAGRYIRTKDRVHASMRNIGVYDEDALNTVTNVVTGYTTDAGDLDMFSPDGSEESMAARATFTAVTGKELPDTAAGTQEVLDEHIGEQTYMNEENNYVGSKMHDMFVAVQAVADDLGDEAGHTLENLMVNNNVPLDEVEQFADAFRQNYTAGALGLSYERTMAASPYLEQYADSSMPKIAYEAGSAVHENEETVQAIKEKERQRKEKQAETKKKTAKKKRKGTFTDKTKDDTISKKQKKILKKLAEAIGVDIVLEDSLSEGGVEANGYYSGGVIHISATSQDPYITVFKHELTHHLQKTAPEEYKALRDFVVREWYNGDAKAVQAAVQAKIDAYRREGAKPLTPDEAMDEIIADASEEFFRNDETINKVIQANRSLGEKILDWIRSIIADIKALMAEMGEGEYKGKGKFLSDLGILEEAEELWTKALGRSVESDVEVSGTEDTKFLIKYDDNGREYVLLTENVFDNKPENIKAVDYMEDYIREYIENHAEEIYPIIESGQPVYLGDDLPGEYKSSKYTIKLANGRRDLLNVKNQAAQNFGEIISIASNRKWKGNTKEKHRVDAKYGFYRYTSRVGLPRKNGNVHIYQVKLIIRNDADGKKYLYDIIDIKKAGKTHISIQDDGYRSKAPVSSASENNIPQESEDSKKKLSLKQDEDYMKAVNAGDMKTAQKMVDEAAKKAGYNYHGYHGTASEFNVFSKDTQGRNWSGDSRLGRGFYFAHDEYTAQRWTEGTRIIDAYLSMNKPLDLRKAAPKDMAEKIKAHINTKMDNYDESYPISEEEYKNNLKKIEDSYMKDPASFIDEFKYDKNGQMTDGIRELLSEMGYDGIISEDEMVVFDSSQIKSADPVTYDDKGEVIPLSERFNEKSEDIRFSLQTPVEEAGDLLAMHNLKESDLAGIIELGGMPMPSIAVTNQEHSNYGDITLLFDKNTIDPARKNNSVFGGDAWTPTFPEIQKKISVKVADRIDQRLRDILGLGRNDYTLGDLRLPSLDDDNLTNTLRYNDPYEAFKNDEVFQIAYLKNAKNFDITVPTKEGSIRGLGKQELELLDERLPEITYEDIYDTVNHTMEFEPAVRQARKDYYESKGSNTLKSLTKHLDKEMGYSEVMSRLEATIKFRKEGVPSVVDRDALEAKLNENVDQEGFKTWINNLFEGIIEKTGIRNNKDLFTPAGNRRSWESLHDPVTLENVVRSMRSELAAGGSGLFGSNPKGAAQKRYKSLDDIRADKGRLQTLSEEEYKAQSEAAVGKMSEVCTAIAEHNPGRFSSGFGAAFDVGTYVAEVLNRTRNRRTIQRILENEYNISTTEEQMDDLMDAIASIAELPTGYFEAKPQRAVGLDEVKAAIIPDTVSQEIKDSLNDWGVDYLEYKAGNEEDRQTKVNQAADEKKIRFSIKDSDGNTLSEGQQEYFRDSTARDAEGNLLVLYHGTPKKGFTVFKDWQYFSANKDYATNYADRNEDNLYKVYANVRKPFDTRIPECREIFENEYMGNYSNTPLQESGLPDWTDGYDLTEFLEENGYDYDAVLLDEGATPSENGEVQERGISYVIRNSDQVKNTDNENPTGDPDIRFSLAERTQQQKTIDALNERYPEVRFSLPNIEDTVGNQNTGVDSIGRQLSEGKKKFFKDSYGTDGQGNLAVVYHSTDKGGFTIFNPLASDDHKSLFFTSNLEMSQSYSRRANVGYIDPYVVEAPLDTSLAINNVDDAIELMKSVKDDFYIFKIWHELQEGEDLDEIDAAANRHIGNKIVVVYGENLRESDDIAEIIDDYLEDYDIGDPGFYIQVNEINGDVVGSAKTAEQFIELARKMQREATVERPSTTQHYGESGTYACYLNLKSPLIIDCKGANWDSIMEDGFEYLAAVKIKPENMYPYEDPEKNYRVQETDDGSTTAMSLDEIREIYGDAFADQIEEHEWDYGRSLPDNWREVRDIDGLIKYFEQDEVRNAGAYIRVNVDGEDETYASDAVEDDIFAPLSQYREDHPTDPDPKRINVVWEAKGFRINKTMADDILADLEFFVKEANNYVQDNNPWHGFYTRYGEAFDPEEEGYPQEGSTRDWCEIAYDMGCDGVIFRNLHDNGGMSGSGYEEGDVFVAFDSNQVKSVQNENPTENEDIRFSRNTWEEEQAIRRALTQQEKTIDKLQEKVADLRSEFRRTRVATIDEKVMTKDLRAFLKDWGSGAEISDVLESVKEIHKSLLNKESPDWDRAYEVAEDTAKDIINKVSILHDEMYNRYKELRDYLRKARLQLTEKERTEIPDYNDFRKSNMGKINLVNDGRPVDTVYADLAEVYPEFFNEDSVNTPGEMVMQMVQVIDSLQPYYETMDADAEQDAVAEVALGLIEFAYDPKLRKTFADRAAERQKAAVEKEKEKGRKRRQTDKEKFKEKIAKIKADRKQAIADLKLTEKQRREKLLKQQRQKVKEVREKARQRATRRSNMNSIKRNAEYLSQALLKPTDTKHIPQQYRTAVATMLSSLDFESVHTDAWIKRYGQPSDRVRGLREMAAAYRQIIRSGEDTYLEDPYFEMLVDSLAEHAQGMRLADMDDALLADMATLVKAIRHNISNANRAFNENIKETISELGNKSIEELEQHKKAGNYGGVVGIINKLFNESNVNPGDFFETIGSDTLFSVYQEIRKGFDQHVLNMDEAKERLQSIVDKKQAAAWSEKAKTEKFDLSNGQTIEITPAQKMSLWCLMRRDQARQHILGQGIVLDSVLHKERNVIKKALFGSKTRQQDGTLISFEDVYQIISTVTDEQKKVCRGIMDLMNGTCKQWGNEASMKLYGYEKFNEENYFPIQSAQEWLDSNPTTADQIPKIKSQGMTKAINENANNPIVVGDIFNVVTKHVNDMSMYNTLAVPLTDFERIYNYKQRNENGGLTGKTTKSTLTRYAGEKSVKYINQWLKDVNNYREHDTEVIGKISNQLLANYKKATIGFNLRVLIQQPTALMRSLIILDPRDVAKVITQKPAISVIKEMQEHSPLARWKSDGHFETDISRSLRDDLLGKKYLLDRVTMDPYGFADNLAWASMWKAVKNEIHRTRPELERGSDEYWQAVNERFEYVMDRTQVVDSVFHRSQVMRNQNIMLKMISSFMAEPTKTFNMLRTETIKAARQWQAGNKKEAAGIFSRVAGIFLLNAAAVSAAAAVIDLLRDAWTGDDDDDDKEQKKWDKFFKYLKNNFAGNANPLAQIVGGNTIFNAIEGFDQENLSTKAISDLAGLIDKWQKFADGDSKFSLFGMVKQTITPLGQLIGVPLKNGEREFESVYRTIVGATSGWNVADYLRAKNFNLNPKSEKARTDFMKIWQKAMINGNEKEAQIIKEDMIKEGIADGDAFDKKLWSLFGSNLEEDLLKGKDIDKTVSALKKAGVDEADIKDKIADYLKKRLDAEIKSKDYSAVRDTIKDLKDQGVEQDKINTKIKSVVREDYQSAFDNEDTSAMDDLDKLVKLAGESDVRHYRYSYARAKAKMEAYNAWQRGGKAEAYKVAYKYLNKYPGIYDSADSMLYGIERSGDSTKADWRQGIYKVYTSWKWR